MRGRSLLLGAALGLAAPVPASAQVTPVAPLPGERGTFAVAGDEVLVGRGSGRRFDVRAYPGGALRFRWTAPRGHEPSGRLVASPQTALLVSTTESQRRTVDLAGAFAGPPSGPLSPLGPVRRARGGSFPAFAFVDGERTWLTELRSDLSEARTVVREPGRAPVVARVPARAFVHAFAGDLAVFARDDPADGEGDAPTRLVVRDWRTGADRFSVRIPEGIEHADLRADGRVLVERDGGGIAEVAPGGAGVRVLAPEGERARYAGDHAVFVRSAEREGDEQLMLAGPDGTVRPFGVPSAEISAPVAGEGRIVWAANECVLSAPIDAPTAVAPETGPCARSEVFLDDERNPQLVPSRRIPVVLRCVAAPPPGCRGTVRLFSDTAPVSGSTRYLIAAGTRRRVVLRLTRAGYRRAVRDARGFGGALLGLRAVTVDPEGRRDVLSDGLGVDLPRRRRG